MLRVLLFVAFMVASFSLVVWRQSKALEVLAEIDKGQSSIQAAEAERNETKLRLQALEGRAYVIPAAEKRLGLRLPAADEIEMLLLEPVHEVVE